MYRQSAIFGCDCGETFRARYAFTHDLNGAWLRYGDPDCPACGDNYAVGWLRLLPIKRIA